MSKPLSAEDVKDRSEATDEFVAEVPASQPLVVRETQRLYRLKAGRFVAVVAADTEDEARDLAASHDALQGDWRNRDFASAEFEDTGETHIHGDVLISALAAPPIQQPNKG